jgi:hypothetical protein
LGIVVLFSLAIVNQPKAKPPVIPKNTHRITEAPANLEIAANKNPNTNWEKKLGDVDSISLRIFLLAAIITLV